MSAPHELADEFEAGQGVADGGAADHGDMGTTVHGYFSGFMSCGKGLRAEPSGTAPLPGRVLRAGRAGS
ncbi:hypothetical protein GCM10027570_16910 [Streptomonospora sediminis]